MAKRVAVLAVNPVNGSGLFQYLEAFFENQIPYTVFAVADIPNIRTNSGIPIETHDVIANLKGHEDEYDALVFACGNAVPVFNDHAQESYNKDLMEVLGTFGRIGKLMIGHCAAGMMFEFAGVAEGKRIALHPFIKGLIEKAVATDESSVVDGNYYTAQSEYTLHTLIGDVVAALKQAV